MSTESPRPVPDQLREAKTLLQEAPVAYLAVVENAPTGEVFGRPYVVPINFACVGGLTAAGPEAASLSARGDPGQTAEEPQKHANGYSDLRLFFHTGTGRKTRALAGNPHVCMAVTDSVSFSAGSKPCEDSFHYRSALVWGLARPLEDRNDRLMALNAIVAKYDPGAAGRPFDEGDFAQTEVYEVKIETVSYKEKPRPVVPAAPTS